MTFSEAVKSGFDHYTKFNGRAGRPAFWWWFLFGILVGIGANIIDAIIGTCGVRERARGAGTRCCRDFSVSIRRLHDTDHSGWWLLIGLIPIIGFIVLLIFYLRQSDPGRTSTGRLRWRPSPGIQRRLTIH